MRLTNRPSDQPNQRNPAEGCIVAALSILLWTFGVLVLGLLALLTLPVDIELRLRSDQSPKLMASVRFFGGRSSPVRIFGKGKKKETPAQKHPKQKRNSWVRASALPSSILTLVKDLIGATHVIKLSVDAEFGLGDPAETGQLYGTLSPLIYGTSGFAGADIVLRPNFDHAHLSGVLDATFRVIPIALLAPLARFGWQIFRPVR